MPALRWRPATALLGALAGACAGPPPWLTGDDAAPAPDAARLGTVDARGAPTDAPHATTDARPEPDARPTDAGPEATDDATGAPPDASADNPHGIAFTDVTALVGTYHGGRLTSDGWGLGTGAAIGDVDGDGSPDVFLARCDADPAEPRPSLLLLGSPGGPIEALGPDPAVTPLLAGRCAHGVAMADFDADGDLDIAVTAHGPNLLLENDGTGALVDVATAAGVAGLDDALETAPIFADVNHDGVLDLLVLHHAVDLPPRSDPRNANRLYLGLGDGTFREAAALGDGSSQAALIADLDGDRDVEIYVANDRFAINGNGAIDGIDHDAWLDVIGYDPDGTPQYVDRGAALGVDGPRSSMGVALSDLDADGREEIYVTDWGPNHLHLWNDTTGRYDDVASAWGAAVDVSPQDELYVSWGARFVDLDRDGAQELIVANGTPHVSNNCKAWSQLDRYLRQPAPGAPLVDISAHVPAWPKDAACPPTEASIGSRAAVLGDLDGDGDDDLVIAPYDEPFRFYRNDTPAGAHRSVRVRPIGRVAAPDPVGAALIVERTDGLVLRRQLYAGGDTVSQSDRVLVIGLAEAGIAEATLQWPSGYHQRLDALPGFAPDVAFTAIEPAWLTLSARTAGPDEEVILTYRPFGPDGQPLGVAGLAVAVTRSDGFAVTVEDVGDGSYRVALPHPGQARTTVVTIAVAGEPLIPRPIIHFQ